MATEIAIPQLTDAQLLELREFVKHGPTGEIWAVEWADRGKGTFVAARRCSRPTEQTMGALPVLLLDNDAQTVGWLHEHLIELETWQPVLTPAEAFDAILRAADKVDVAKKLWKDKQADAKSAREQYDEAVEAQQEIIRQAREEREEQTGERLPFGREDGEA